MHEVQVMVEVLDAVLREANKRGAEKVTEVQLEVGELTFLGEEQMRFAFETITKGTIAEGAALDVVHVKGEVRCGGCGHEGPLAISDDPAFHVPFPVMACTRCGGAVKISKGKDCVVKNVRMTVPD